MQVEIKSLQERLAESRKIQMHKRTVLAKEREYYVELYLTNEKQLEHDTSLDKSQLKEFVLKSNDTIQVRHFRIVYYQYTSTHFLWC